MSKAETKLRVYLRNPDLEALNGVLDGEDLGPALESASAKILEAWRGNHAGCSTGVYGNPVVAVDFTIRELEALCGALELLYDDLKDLKINEPVLWRALRNFQTTLAECYTGDLMIDFLT